MLHNPRLILSVLAAFLTVLRVAHTAESPQGDGEAFPIMQRNTVTGEWAGIRSACCNRGVELFAGYTAEVWGNTTGGIKTGSVYTGLLDFGLNLDLEKLAGWKGASMSTTWLWLSGRDASQDLAGNFLTISNIAGFNTLRMLDLWAQQELLDGQLSIRAGQITADSEFLISDYGSLFINGTFGWPSLAYMNLPNGGPGFPVGTPGARLAWNPVDWFTFMTAGFQGNVFAQDVNKHGFRWSLDAETGFTFMNEAQVRWGQADDSKILPGTVKLGAWFQTGQNADALAGTTSSGNSGYYMVLDQMLFREPANSTAFEHCCKDGKCTTEATAPEKNNQGLGCFARLGFTPPDRNVVDFYFDTGVTYKGLIPNRDNDTIGVAFGFAKTSSAWQQDCDCDALSENGAEMVLEATYHHPWSSFIRSVSGAEFNSSSTTSMGGRSRKTQCKGVLLYKPRISVACFTNPFSSL